MPYNNNRSLYQTISSLSKALETRDLYTSDHQSSVSNLARIIAEEMGLSNSEIECVRVAGTLHDIGKIGVPAEILNKPAKLNKEEYALIQLHSMTGEKILSSIDFPWPVDQIVRQHHERMDGTGYPDKLIGTDILKEARIIAVADVVDSIVLPRPYRKGLGIEAAKYEITKNKSVLYDPNIVDACLHSLKNRKTHLKKYYQE